MCEVLVDYPKNLFMSCNAFQMIIRGKKGKECAKKQKVSSATMSRINRNDVPPPVSLDTHPLRGISRKPGLHKSTPDLAKIGSNNSSTESLTIVSPQRRSHHSSHEDVAGVPPAGGKVHPSSDRTRSTLDPSSRYEWNEAFVTQHTADPSARYEWNESFIRSKPKSSGKVSEGYCRLNILNEKDKPPRPASCGDYSVLNLPAGPSPRKENDGNATNTHNYFTLEVLDDPGTKSGSNSPQMIIDDPPESEGLYFTLEETSSSHQPPQSSGSSSTAGVRSCQQLQAAANKTVVSLGYSYVELDTDDEGKSPPVLVNTTVIQHKNKGKPLLPSRSAGHLSVLKENTYDTLCHDTYDTLCHDGVSKKPPRSVSQSDYRSSPTSPRVAAVGRHSQHVQPDSIHQTISPPTLPYHKKDFNRIPSCPNNTRGEPRTSHSPKSPLATTTVIHDYAEVEIDDGSDDDVPISLPSPTSPGLPLVDERVNSPSHDSMVQLIITDQGPLLLPRKRSMTADPSNLRRFRDQQNSSRPLSHQQNHHQQQQQQRATSAFANK